jgi:hypothetical protein
MLVFFLQKIFKIFSFVIHLIYICIKQTNKEMEKINVTIYEVIDAEGNSFTTVANDEASAEHKFFINDAVKKDGSTVSSDFHIYSTEEWANENDFNFNVYQTQLPVGKLNPAMDGQPWIAKERAIGAMKRENERIAKEREIEKLLYKSDNAVETTIVSDSIAIIKTRVTKKDQESDFYKGHEFYYQSVVNGSRLSSISFSFDEQLLLSLGAKHDGINSQFAMFATRMLNIKS